MSNIRENIAIYLNVHTKRDGECLVWTGNVQKRGYGRVDSYWEETAGEQYAHRLSYAFHNGVIWPGHNIIHRCSNKTCVDPKHLEQVEACETHKWRDANGHTVHGSRHGIAKLCEPDILAIRALKGVLSSYKVGAIFGVNGSTILKIWRRTAWKQVA